MLQQTVAETNALCPLEELDGIHDLRSSADPDADLVQALKARTAGAFDDLVERYRRRLLNVAVRILKNREDAEDIVQESFLNVFKNIDGFRARSKFSTWLIRIVSNQALMAIRSNTQKFVSIDEDRSASLAATTNRYTPEQLYSQHEFEDVLLRLLNVRKAFRRVLELRVNDGLSPLEISQVLGLTLAAVKSRLHRGRLDLREAMGRHFRSTKLEWTSKKRSAAAARRSNLLDNILPETHSVHCNGKRKQRSSWTNASGLAGDNPLTARSSQSVCDVESCLPDHFATQLLTQPQDSSVSRPENCF